MYNSGKHWEGRTLENDKSTQCNQFHTLVKSNPGWKAGECPFAMLAE
jgi:hypothetical protein